jgi:hypothetical protein
MNNVQNETSTTEPRILDMSNVEDAILARWEDAEETQPSEDDSEEATSEIEEETVDDEGEEELDPDELEEADEDPEESEEAESDEDEDESEDDDPVVDDDTEVEILVDGETHRASIKSLKRLFGVEKSLTRKSQEVAKQRKEADNAIQKNQVVFDRLLQQAQERYKPYQDVDMLVASKSMSAEDFAQLRKEAAEAYKDVQFLTEEADSYFGELQAQQQTAMKEAAKECVKVLNEQIPEWSNEMYSDIRSYAISQGLPEEQVNQYVDPVVIQILNKARLFDEGRKVATVKKKQTAKKKVLRSKKAPPNEVVRKQAANAKAREKMRASKDLDDIADVLLSRWEA